jgi:hypothetical protein
MVARGNTFDPGSKPQDLRNRCQTRQHFAAKLSDRKHSKPRNKKRRFHGISHRNGVEVLPVGIQQLKKQGENRESVSGGAPGGAKWRQNGASWVEIREMIRDCIDLPESARNELILLGNETALPVASGRLD